MLKKLFAMAMAALMVVMFASCGGNTNTTNPNGNGTEVTDGTENSTSKETNAPTAGENNTTAGEKNTDKAVTGSDAEKTPGSENTGDKNAAAE